MTPAERDLLLYLANLVKNGMTSIMDMIAEIVVATGDYELMVSVIAKVGALQMAIKQEEGTLEDLLS